MNGARKMNKITKWILVIIILYLIVGITHYIALSYVTINRDYELKVYYLNELQKCNNNFTIEPGNCNIELWNIRTKEYSLNKTIQKDYSPLLSLRTLPYIPNWILYDSLTILFFGICRYTKADCI